MSSITFPKRCPKTIRANQTSDRRAQKKQDGNRGTNTDEHGLRALNQKDRTPAHTQMNTGLLLFLSGKLAGSQRFAVATNCL